MENINKQVAKASLEIQAIKLSPDNPFQWASGYRMPIYNDNRMLLGNYEHRKLVAEGLIDIIKSKGLEYDAIAGTSTAGIAPAASVALELGVPLLIMEEGKFFSFKNPLVETNESYDLIASTCPWAIPYGISLANIKQTPFAYVRQKAKGHGMKQQIEGIVKQDQKTLLVDYNKSDSYSENAVEAIKEKGVTDIQILSEDISAKLVPITVEGKKIILIEDLVSTGGSSVKEFAAYKEAGAAIDVCLSIFNYGLDEANKQFKEAGCINYSLLTYPVMLDVAKDINYIDEKQLKLLEDWRADPFNWGGKNGFPKVEK